MPIKDEPRQDTRGWVKRHPVASFFVLAYAITWLAWLPAMMGYRGDLGQVLSMIAQFGPALAALVLIWYTGTSMRSWTRSNVRWRVSSRWYVVAVGLPVVLIFVQGTLFGLFGYPLDISSIPGRLVNFLPSVIILALIAGRGTWLARVRAAGSRGSAALCGTRYQKIAGVLPSIAGAATLMGNITAEALYLA